MKPRAPGPQVAAVGRHLRAVLAAASGRTRHKLAAQRGAIAVLVYHRIVPDDAETRGLDPGMYVRASVFDRHLAWIGRSWEIRTLRDVLGDRPDGIRPPTVCITFDDGWRDNLTVAWPILERHGARATIFLVRNWVEAGRTEYGEFLRPTDVRDLAREGMHFGAHSSTHPRLDALDDGTVEDELRRSKAAVEEWSGSPCETFAYPFGAQRAATADIARRHFSASFVNTGGWWRPGRSDRALLPRIRIHDDVSTTRMVFHHRLAGWGD